MTSLEKYNHSVRRHHRWNTSVGWLDGIFFALGGSLVSHITVLPIFLRLLTESKMVIGLVHTITMVGIFLPQIISAHHIESMPLKKGLVTLIWAIMRLPWLILALLLPFMVRLPFPWPVVIFLLLYLVFTLGWGFGIPPWLDMIGRIILPRKRGAFLGIRFTLGRIFGMIGAVFSIYLIEAYPFPYNFAICFAAAFIFMNISLFFFALTREIPYPVVKKKIAFVDFMRALPDVFRRDPNFFYYNISFAFIAFTNLTLAFYSVYAVERFSLSSSYAGIFTAVFMASQAATGALWGFLGDRWGHKFCLVLSAIMSILAAVAAYCAPSVHLFYATFFFAGGYMSGALISNMNIVLEFCSPEERPLYIGLSNSFAAPVFIVSPLLGGWIVDHFSYRTAFATNAILTSVGLMVLLFFVKDPRRTPRQADRSDGRSLSAEPADSQKTQSML